MDSLEKAIRLAFDKGDPADPEFRKRVYRSAINALDKSSATNPNMTPEAARQRVERLKAIIRNVETEFRPADDGYDGQTVAAPPPTLDDVAPAAEGRLDGTGTAAARDLDFGPAPYPGASDRPYRPARETPMAEAEDAGKAQSRKTDAGKIEGRRIFGVPFFVGLLIVAAIAAWLFSKYGDAPRPNAVAPDTSEAPALQGQIDNSKWVKVFDAENAATVKATEGITLEVTTRDETKMLRIDAKGNKTASVVFEVGEGVLRDFAGGRAVFDIVARAQEGSNAAVSVECDFGGTGCGRRRYEINFAPGEYLFDVELPETVTEAGTITLTPDTTGTGQPLDIAEIRIGRAPEQ